MTRYKHTRYTPRRGRVLSARRRRRLTHRIRGHLPRDPLDVALAPRRPPGAIGHRGEPVRGAVDELTDAHLLAVVEDPSTHGDRRATDAVWRAKATFLGANVARECSTRARRAANARKSDGDGRVEALERGEGPERARRRRRETRTRTCPPPVSRPCGTPCARWRRARRCRRPWTGRRRRDVRRDDTACRGRTRADERGRRWPWRAHAGGKVCGRGHVEKEKRATLVQYAPHIVESKYVPGHVFCRLTGSRIKANEEAVVRHASGNGFRRARRAGE